MKVRSILGLVAATIVMASGPALAGETFMIDPVHSSVTFSVQHMAISKVRGSFPEVSGKIVYDKNDMTKSSIDVTIQAASIDTKNEKRDGHLRSADFLDVENHPEITFKSKKIEKRDDGWVAVGTLTIRGTAKEVVLPFEFNGLAKDPWGNMRLGASAQLTIDRTDFGLEWNQVLEAGGFLVGDEVDIDIAVEGVKESQSG